MFIFHVIKQSFNKKYPLFASASGQRKTEKLMPGYVTSKGADSSSDEDEKKSKEDDYDHKSGDALVIENSLKVWKHSLVF